MAIKARRSAKSKAGTRMGPWKSFVDNVASKMAFFPPSPPSYEIKDHGDGTGEMYLEPTEPNARKVLNCDIFTLRTKNGNEIVAAFVPTKKISQPTLLYSHGNAVDLGQMLPFFKELSVELRCNVMGFDYAGYGRSMGTPSVANTQADIAACVDWLRTCGKEDKDIILYGQSVGSGPSVWMAAQRPEIGGLVLHSALSSGMRVINPNWKWWPSWADVYPNAQLLPKVKARTLVIHGTNDDVVHLTHGQMLHSLAKNASMPLWARGCDHQNVELSPHFLPRLRDFLTEVFGKDYWKT